MLCGISHEFIVRETLGKVDISFARGDDGLVPSVYLAVDKTNEQIIVSHQGTNSHTNLYVPSLQCTFMNSISIHRSQAVRSPGIGKTAFNDTLFPGTPNRT